MVPDLTNVINTERVTRVLDQGVEIADIPAPINEPNTPWVIAQWRYQAWNPVGLNYFPDMLQFLAKSAQREIRFVEVAGMTDYNTGDNDYYLPYSALDINATDSVNNVDTEVRFLLANVFNPQSLGNTLKNATDDPFMWIGLGQSSATTDSAGAAVMSDFGSFEYNEPLGLFDRNDTAFPWSAPVIDMKGTIPFGLDWTGNYAGYIESFSNTAKGTGNDATTYMRTGLNGFAFKYYDDELGNVPQPIAGGYSRTTSDYWYPSKNPLNERWAPSWTPASYYNMPDNGIITLGGMKANGLTRYFNDFTFAISREGNTPYAMVNGGSVTGSAPTSNPNIQTLDYFPISTWASSNSSFGYTEGYAVIAMARDINGTRGLEVYGWDGRDTYWASAWASQYLNDNYKSFLPEGTVSLVLKITYTAANREPTAFTIVKALGTITEFGINKYVVDYLGFDLISMSYSAVGPNYGWTGSVAPMSLPNGASAYDQQWWYEKLPTTSAAKVDFDP